MNQSYQFFSYTRNHFSTTKVATIAEDLIFTNGKLQFNDRYKYNKRSKKYMLHDSSIATNQDEICKIIEIYEHNSDCKKRVKKAILEFYYDQKILFCPYCGLNQFQIITDDKLSSFDLDHFLPRSIFPQFALSLYNLFPVCKFCNQTLKRDNNPLEHNKMVFHLIR